MNPTLAPIERPCWHSEELSRSIECSPAVLEEIRVAAVDGFNRVGHGGVEIGGVLYGVREGDTLRIVARRAVACEYACGPSFVLSASDEAAFQAALALPESDGDLSGLEPVGWYRSQTRPGDAFTPKYAQFHARHFPEEWQVALVLRPSNFGPSTVGFFFRGADGVMRGEAAALEVAGARRPRVAEPPPVENRPRLPRMSEPARPKPRKRRLWLAGLALAAALSIGGSLILRHTAEPPLTIQASDNAGQLRIQWDRAAPAVLRTSAAWLDIRDGDASLRLPLAPEQLRHGNVVYARKAGSVTVRLTLERQDGAPVVALTQFLGLPPRASSEPPPAPLKPLAQEPEPEPAPPVEEEPPPRRLRLPSPRAVIVARKAALPAPPAFDVRLAPVMPRGITSLPQAAPPPPPPARVAHPASAPQPPRAGGLLWTGVLRKHGIVEIDGPGASMGFVSAALPGVPVRITVLPAELTAGGLVVYVSGGPAASEPPGPENGWNQAAFVANPAAARAIVVLEAPGPQNGWKRLVFRNDSRPRNVVMIRWMRE